MSPDIELDIDGDGKITQEEAQLASKLEKDSTMLSQSWLAITAMCIYPFLALLPLDADRLQTIGSISDLFYISMAGVIAAAYGSQVVLKRNGNK